MFGCLIMESTRNRSVRPFGWVGIPGLLLCVVSFISSIDAFHVSKRLPIPVSNQLVLSISTSLMAKKRAAPNSSGNKGKGARFSQTVHRRTANQADNNYNPDRMWKNKKSIEQLEDRLVARWGTDLKTWTAQDGEFEDDEGDFEMDPSAEISDERMFRGRPVKDPWQSRDKKNENSPLMGGGDDEKVSIRARKNQERLKASKGMTESSNEEPEFYDHDDVGYEPTVPIGGKGIHVEDLVAPKPVGGQGNLEKDSSDSGDKDTFFFSSPRERSEPLQKTKNARENKTKGREQKKRSKSLPLLDEEGNPLFLTVDQAQRNFEGILAESDSMTDGESDDSENGKEWTDLGITSDILLKNLNSMGCGKPLAVQGKSCPSVLEDMDVLVGTYTGSGKTLSFLVPLAQKLLDDGITDSSIQTIIVAPGRELASQIVSVARDLLEGSGIRVMLAIGGTTFSRNLEQIRKQKPTILIGTPGRIAELVVGKPGEKRGRLKITLVRNLVLDEFDALLEYKPHREPTNAIISHLKRQRGDGLQSILCSATATDLMGSPKLENYLRENYAVAMADDDDLLVTSGDDPKKGKSTRVSRTVMHGVIHLPHRRFALSTLRSILHTDPLPQQILIFAENSRKVKIVVEKLEGMGIIAAPLHGGVGSEKMDRAEVTKALREGYVGIVVATEMAARGLDAPLLTHVINLDLPTDDSHYAHRAGRCGRGGRPGVVINLTTSPQERNVPQKFADRLGIEMFSVEPRNGRLNIVEPSSQDRD